LQTVGQLFTLKEPLTEIKSELTPSFDEVIKSYLGLHVRTKFKDPTYVTEITYPTPPLEIFIKRILNGLRTPTVQGTYLIRGFGFGKTHAIILLWHILNSEQAATSQLAKKLGADKTLAQETLVLGADFSKEQPFTQFINQLHAIAKRTPEQWNIKDIKLSQATLQTLEKISKTEALSFSSEGLAQLIVETAEKYKKLGGNPRLLLLIDELGIGIITRLTDYIETQNEEKYAEIERIINFIEQLYAKLSGKGIPTFIIVALAEQDMRELDSIYLQQTGKPIIQNKIQGLQKRLTALKERLSRAAGGLGEEAALSYDPEHAINIAKHRVFQKADPEKTEETKNALISYLTLQAEQYNLTKTLEEYKEQIKTYYPLSPSLIWLLKKTLNPSDAPRTEYVRTTLYIVAEAAENALTIEPDKALTVGIKHIPLPRAGIVDLMAEFEAEWTTTVSDMEHAIRSATPELQTTIDIIAKQILAKGTTANVTTLIEMKDLKELKKYAVSPEEMQIDMLTLLPQEEASKSIGRVQEAIEYLKTQSARIEEKEYGEQKFYIPSLMRTIYDKLAAFVSEQRRILEEPAQLPFYIQQANLPSLFLTPKAAIPFKEKEVTILLKEYNTVSNIEDLINNEDIRTAQREGNLSIILVPPWDPFLFNELYQRKTDYDTIVNSLTQKLQSINLQGKIARPLHLILLIPNINPDKLERLIEDVISYRAVKEFLEHLKHKEKILEEKLYDYERTLQKRLTLRLTEFFEEQRRKLQLGLKNSLEQQIRDARTSAQKELVKLTRKIATSAIELYEHVVFYSLQTQNFMSQSLVKLFSEPEIAGKASSLEQSGKSLFSDYSLIINTFFKRVIESIGFVWDPSTIADAIHKHYETEIKSGVIREKDRISDIVENAMLGTYEVKPLSTRTVEEAILKLDGETIEIEDRKITIKIDAAADLIQFQVQELKPPEELEREAPPIKVEVPAPIEELEKPEIKTLNEITIDVDPKFNYEDFKAKLDTLYKTYGTLISSIRLESIGNVIRATFNFLGTGHSPSTIVNVARFLKQVSNVYKVSPYVEIKFTSPLPQDKLEEIFGSFLTKKVRRSWDRLLPT